MSNYPEITVNVDEKLALNKFNVNEEYPHIEVQENAPVEEFRKLVLACPAALFKVDEEGNQSYDYAGCLECGTCRVVAGDTIIKKWTFPIMGIEGGSGVQYLYG